MKLKLKHIRPLARLPAIETGAVELTTLETVKSLRPEVASCSAGAIHSR